VIYDGLNRPIKTIVGVDTTLTRIRFSFSGARARSEGPVYRFAYNDLGWTERRSIPPIR